MLLRLGLNNMCHVFTKKTHFIYDAIYDRPFDRVSVACIYLLFKRLLHLKINTCNATVYGELGR